MQNIDSPSETKLNIASWPGLESKGFLPSMVWRRNVFTSEVSSTMETILQTTGRYGSPPCAQPCSMCTGLGMCGLLSVQVVHPVDQHRDVERDGAFLDAAPAAHA